MALFITLEGGEGAGKTVVAERLAAHMRATGAEVVRTFEPGGTPLGAALRAHLFAEDTDATPWTETFLFLADRAHHVQQVIRPALARGAVVLCDRYADSTLAYQGYGRGLDLDLLKRLNRIATDGILPQLTLLLTVPVQEGLRRARPEPRDRIGMAPLAFHERVAAGFQRIAQEEPERVRVIDAMPPLEAVVALAWELLAPRLERTGYRT